jgi:hypothetical protein
LNHREHSEILGLLLGDGADVEGETTPALTPTQIAIFCTLDFTELGIPRRGHQG